MDEARAEIVINAIYTSPQNPTSDDFAEIMGMERQDSSLSVSKVLRHFFFLNHPGLQSANSESVFSNLNEVLKLIGCCHLVSDPGYFFRDGRRSDIS